MECPDLDLVLDEAKTEDHDAIIAITEGEELFGGLDYLPSKLRGWLKEGEDQESCRRNLIFIRSQKIVGFISLHFQNGRKACVKFAFRISKMIRGQGYGRCLTELVQKYLRENFSMVEKVISAIGDHDLTDEEIRSSKHGEALVVKSLLVYFFDMENITIAKTEENNLSLIQKTEFAKILRSQETVSFLLECNLVHMDFIPILLDTETDIEIATRQDQEVLLSGSLDQPTSFSILTLPYSVPKGNTRCAIDVFSKKEDDLKKHIQQQIILLSKRKKSIGKGKTFLLLTVDQTLEEAALEAMESVGLGKYLYVFGNQRREVTHMFVYQKQVSNI